MSETAAHNLSDLYAELAAGGLVRRLFEIARDEDLGPDGRDLTGELMPGPQRESAAVVRAREPVIVSGLAAVAELLDVFEAEAGVEMLASDGQELGSGAEVMRLEGAADQIVRVERTLLNILGRLAGIAALTQHYTDRVAGRAELLDTRKTTPGLRVLEKYAVACGGGTPHRLGLHDAVLIKDNHLAGMTPHEIAAWLGKVSGRARESGAAFVQVEVDTLDQFRAVLGCDAGTVDFVLLDNMTTEQLAAAVSLRDNAGSAVRLEASGGITLETIDAVAGTGVDRISVGALTRDARSADFGLDR
ncbi:MAG: carboxylating nicotinate-nucleotide diphosphorylase [Planctomycetota bacterium]